jgi:hypothetical protein
MAHLSDADEVGPNTGKAAANILNKELEAAEKW